MFKRFFLVIFFLMVGCTSVVPPENFVYKEVETSYFTLASWQKITNPTSTVKIYIEGDGNAFDYKGRPSNNPTPKGQLVRDLAFNDSSPNVVYLARLCQFVQDSRCGERYWTTARFAPEVIFSVYEAIIKITKKRDVILIGYSGGAQVIVLLAEHYPDLNIRKIITIAGVLDHTAWTTYHNDPPLSESIIPNTNLKLFKQITQIHYVGGKDKVVPPVLIQNIPNPNMVILVPKATHNSGFDAIFPLIWQEK